MQKDRDLPDILRPLAETPERDAPVAAAGRIRFLAEAAELRRQAAAVAAPRPWWQRRPLALAFACLLIFALCGGGGLTYAAQRSLPGELLYGAKLQSEQTRLALARDADSEITLRLAFANRRLDEAAALAQTGRIADLKEVISRYEGEMLAAGSLIQFAQRDFGVEMAQTLAHQEAVLSQVAVADPTLPLPQFEVTATGALTVRPRTVPTPAPATPALTPAETWTPTPTPLLPEPALSLTAQPTSRPPALPPASPTARPSATLPVLATAVGTMRATLPPPLATATPTASQMPTSTSLPLATATPLAELPTATPPPTSTLLPPPISATPPPPTALPPTATFTPEPSPTAEPPRGEPVVLVGLVDTLAEQELWIGEVRVVILPRTEIRGELVQGAAVVVEGRRLEGTVRAVRIRVLHPPLPDRVVLRGLVTERGERFIVVRGERILITQETVIHGEVAQGVGVFVLARPLDGGGLRAALIYVLDQP